MKFVSAKAFDWGVDRVMREVAEISRAPLHMVTHRVSALYEAVEALTDMHLVGPNKGNRESKRRVAIERADEIIRDLANRTMTQPLVHQAYLDRQQVTNHG